MFAINNSKYKLVFVNINIELLNNVKENNNTVETEYNELTYTKPVHCIQFFLYIEVVIFVIFCRL